MLTWMIAILARKKNITKLTKTTLENVIKGALVCLFLCLFVGGCCWRPSDRWGEKGENVFVRCCCRRCNGTIANLASINNTSKPFPLL
jgi:hypothetical protein